MVENEYMDGEVILSTEGKIEYLVSLLGKTHKILHLFEEEKTTGFSPKLFIYGQLVETNAANTLFHGKLTNIIVKLKAVYDGCGVLPFEDCRRQLLEIDKIIKSLKKNLEAISNGRL